MAKGAINVQITGDYSDKDIKRAIKDLESLQSQGAPAAKSVGGLTTAFKGMALAAGAFVSISAVKDFIGDAISAGSDLEESLSKVNVVFGDSADAVVAWADDSAKAFGQSRQQALESVGTFGNLLQAFGSTQSEAQVMSQRMVELAADLASFNNTSVEDALQAIQSGLSGETEPLKRFGVALNDARLKAVALEKGLYSGKGTLDVYAKSVAAYELILKDTALAQGDFARTSDGFANQMRILEATVDDAKATIGTELLIGINGVTEALGGTDGMTGAVEFATEIVADFVAGLGQAVISLSDFAKSATEVVGVDIGDYFNAYLTSLNAIIPGSGTLVTAILGIGSAERDHREAMEKSTAAAEDLYAGYIQYADGAEQASDATYVAEQAAADAETALKELKAAVGELNDKMSDLQAGEEYRRYLRDLEGDLEKVKNKTLGLGPASDEARDALLDAFAKASEAATDWAEETGASPEQLADKFATEGKKMVQRFVDAGFKRSDIKKFLKDQGLWMSEFNKVGDYAKAAGVNIGKDLISGIKGSLSDPNNLAALRYAGMQAALAAEEGARSKDGADTGSPSKKWKKLGGDLMSGLAIGIKSKNDDLKADAADTMQGILDKATEIVSGWDDKIKDALDANNDAKQAITDWAASTRDTLVSAFDLSAVFEGSYDEEGNFVASKFFGGMDAAIAKFEWYNNVLRKIKESGGSDQLVAFLQSQGVDKGGVWGQSLIDEGLVDYMNQNLAKVTTVAGTTAQATVPAFLLAAEENSAALYNQVVKDYGKDGEKRKKLEALMDRLAKALNRTSTITVKTVYEAAGIDGKRAAGGPVSANKAYLVGERGPEVLVMGGQSGTIIPNGDLPMASGGVRGSDGANLGGNSYSITVQAGVGDPRAIGQQVVEVIRRFESANGRVFAAA